MKKACFFAALFIALLLSCTAELSAEESSLHAHVLLLHSYSQGMLWADDTTAGVRSVLADAGVELHIEYMDTKRKADKGAFELLAGLYRYRFRPDDFDLIIASDDDALQFLFTYRDEIFPGVPVVFCGINQYSPDLLAGKRGYTGIIETTDHLATMNLALSLHPAAQTLYVIGDRTTTGLIMRDQLESSLPALSRPVQLRFIDNVSIEELTIQLRTLDRKTAVYLMSFHQDRTGRTFTTSEVASYVTNSAPVPVYATGYEYLGKGIVGGYLRWGFTQGETAARLATEILRGRDPASIPILLQSPSSPIFDHRQLVRFGIPERSLPEGSEIRYIPDSFYQRFKPWIWTAVVFISSLTVLVVFLIINIGKLKKTEKLLKSREEKYRTILEYASEGVLVISNHRLLFANPALLKMTGYTLEEIGSIDRIFEIIHPEDVRTVETRYAERIAGEKTDSQYPLRFITSGGDTKWVLLHAARIQWEGVPSTLYLLSDITELRQIEEGLMKTQKYESIGLLAGGIAHDFSNILAAVMGNLSLLKIQFTGETENARILDDAITYAKRAREYTRQLLMFARGSDPMKKMVKLQNVVEDTLRFLSNGLGIRCRIDFPPDLEEVHADPGQVTQIFQNLLINADQATHGDGTVLISGCRTVLPKGASPQLPPGAYLLVSVCDDGPGIPPEAADRIFDPYFTTKENGSGLGLSIAYSIMKAHNGIITVENTAPHGTAFRLYFPLPSASRQEIPQIHEINSGEK